MVFSSIEFLFAFLPVALVLTALAPRVAVNAVLLLLSLLFYAWGGGAFLFVLLGSIACNYVLGLAVHRAPHEGPLRSLCIAGSVTVNVGLLAVFKYANFAVGQWNALAPHPVEWSEIALPIGISFFTFQSMSYVFDVARGAARPFRNPIDFALYVAMFPQLIAGPIVRFHEIADSIRARSTRLEDVSQGVLRFSHGLVKKVVIADSVGAVAEASFSLPPGELSGGAAWLGALAYTLQIYFDFSAYSDMAIGLGRILGFRLPENFDRPYSAVSITDFWRRWHITLSTWFRDYLYLPLGGSRHGAARTVRNLVLVFLLTGIWHGANWTFLVWGVYHGALLLIERFSGRRHLDGVRWPWLARARTQLLVGLGWVVFRADDLPHALGYFGAMLGAGAAFLAPDVALALSTRNTAALVAASLVFALPASQRFGRRIADEPGAGLGWARAALMLVALPYALLLVMSGTFSPFLYFQF